MIAWVLQPPSWWPILLLALPAVLLCGWLGSRARRRLREALGDRTDELCGAPAFRRTRRAAAIGAVLACVAALLRPVAPGREAQLAPDMALCVDVSFSMAARDASPDRFGALRAHVHELLEQAVGSRFALLAFAGGVEPLSPLTADRRAIGWLLDELLPGAVAAGGTDVGAAIEAAAVALERTDTLGDIVVLTDGEDFGGAVLEAARAAAAAGHRVHCIGYGSRAGSKIVLAAGPDGGEERFLQDQSGADVVTRLDEAGLRALADAGDGRLLLAREVDSLVPWWRDELVPAAAERRLRAGEGDVVPRFQWPLFVAVLLWMLRLCLPERRR